MIVAFTSISYLSAKASIPHQIEVFPRALERFREAI